MNNPVILEMDAEVPVSVEALVRVIGDRCVARILGVEQLKGEAILLVQTALLPNFRNLSLHAKLESDRVVSIEGPSPALDILKKIAAGTGGAVSEITDVHADGSVLSKRSLVVYDAPPSIAAKQGEPITDLEGMPEGVTPCFAHPFNRGYTGVYDIQTVVAVLRAENFPEASIAYARKQEDSSSQMPITINENEDINIAVAYPHSGNMMILRRVDSFYRSIPEIEKDDLSHWLKHTDPSSVSAPVM